VWAVGLAFVVASLGAAGVAHAKPWAQWAPAPLASDSAFAALQARPPEALTAAEASWLSVQRYWRAQRADEDAGSMPSSITSPTTASGHGHHARRGDERFAALASRPFGSLEDRDLAWLVAENAAQRDARESASVASGRTAIGLGLLAGVAGLIAGAWLAVDAIFGN
jgi:hypothetical protein